ncbi:3-deoxy-7-phosphoheptulonate synthase [Sphingomonas sp. MMS24-JH45]
MPQLSQTTFYTSHEALLLPFEEAMTRLSADRRLVRHLGDTPVDRRPHPLRGLGARRVPARHRQPDRGEVRASLEPDALLAMLDTLNPDRVPGRMTLITRYGYDKIEAHLADSARAVTREGHPVVWSCDPMHGNVVKAANGDKTRPFDRILAEVRGFFAVHRAEGTHAGGIHAEMTGQNVTECTGGAIDVTEQSLADRYHTHCDPRLNAGQSLELAFLLAEMLNAELSERRRAA